VLEQMLTLPVQVFSEQVAVGGLLQLTGFYQLA
jgi:hypothetical protein